MGLFKKIFRPVRKIAKKIIPKEIRPALPFIASAYFGPSTGGLGNLFTREGAKLLAQKAAIAAGTAAATDEDANLARVAALSIAPDVLGSASESAAGLDFFKNNPKTISALEKTASFLRPESGVNFDQAKLIGSQTAIDQSAKFAEIRQDEIDEYNRNLLEQGVQDKTKRRAAIFGIYKNAGYDDDYVNNMLDRYGYDDGGEVPGQGKKTDIEKAIEKLNEKKDDDDSKNLAGGLMAAAEGVEKAFGRGFGEIEPVPMLRFARGGEVEIEEETDDLGIMDLMRDQGIEYGEQASYGFDDAMGESFEMFQDYRKRGLIPLEMEFDEFLEIMRESKKSKDGIMQMASGYKDDIDEMYEQYVFEMEEQGLEPMSFSQFLARERAGMEDGGKVKRRKKGEPADEIIETEEEIFLDTMPRPKRQGIMEAADGGIMEKDMRGGGFIPEGSKERADDVPARLSKNEFVMTADAVRAAGGGSVNKGAKRMYDMMYNLEGKV